MTKEEFLKKNNFLVEIMDDDRWDDEDFRRDFFERIQKEMY